MEVNTAIDYKNTLFIIVINDYPYIILNSCIGVSIFGIFAERSEEEPCDVRPVDLYTLRELSNNWRGLKNPPILVRIVSRKRILHYAKMTKNDKWPLQVWFYELL